MDEDLIRKAKELLNARLYSPAPNIYNIVIPVTEQDAGKLLDLLLFLLSKRDDFGTSTTNSENFY